MEKASSKNRILSALILTVSVSFMLFIYAPYELFLTNRDEFFFDARMMFGPLFLMFIAFTIITVLVLILINKTILFIPAIALEFCAFICAYIQGNFMSGSLPHIKGEMIDWNAYPGQRISSLILWMGLSVLIVISIILIICKKLKEDTFLKIIRYISAAVGTILLVTLLTLGIPTGGFADKELVSSVPTSSGMLNCSEDQNFLILLLDKVDAAEVKRLMGEKPEYKEIFKDFTFYSNAESGYPYTKHSIPHILTGLRYEKQCDYDEYLQEAYSGSPLLNSLYENDYSIGIYETDLDVRADVASNFDNMAKCERSISSWINFDKWMCVMTGYRYFPYDLKKYSYLYTNVFNTLKVPPEGEELYDDNNGFIWEKLNNDGLIATSGNNFRFIHIQGAHEWLYDENVNPIQNGTYEDSVKASLTIAQKYLELYRNAGAYDNSIIMIMADHGALDPKQQNPVLMIKGFDEKHDMTYNDAPISYDDLTEAYLRLLENKKSDELFDYKEGDQRERRLLFEDDDNNPDHIMEEYVQTGHAGDMDTLTLVRKF